MTLALACLHTTSAKLNMNHICALVNDGIRIASFDACEAYYVCQNGIATRQDCPPNNYFDKESQSCLPQKQVKCLAPSNVPCSGYNYGSWAPVSGSCTDFYYCSLNGPERSSCPFGEYFNPQLEACVYPTQYPCSVESSETGSTNVAGDSLVNSSESSEEISDSTTITLPLNLCNFFSNSMFFGSPSNCNGWNKCNDNIMQSGICPNGLMYNVLTMTCDYAAQVSCRQVKHHLIL